MTIKICGKDYIVPELTFDHAELIDVASDGNLYDAVYGKWPTMSARIFIQIVTGADADTAKALLSEHIRQNGHMALATLVDAFVDSMLDSDFFCALLGLPNKAEREKAAREKAEAEKEAVKQEAGVSET